MEELFKSADCTIIAQKALSAIKRANEEIDIATAVEILRGIKSPTVKEKGYDQLKTFGVGQDVTVYDWLYYFDQMLKCELLATDDLAEKLTITEKGNNILSGDKTAWLAPQNSHLSPDTISLYASMGILTVKDVYYQELLLYKRLRGLSRSFARHQNRNIESVLDESTLRSIVIEKPLSIDLIKNYKKINKRQNLSFLKLLVSTIRRHLNLSPLEPEKENTDEIKRTRPQKQFLKTKTISINKTPYEIAGNLVKCINWSGVSSEIRNRIWWNLWQDTLIPIVQLIPEDTENREAVVKRFIEILRDGYQLQVRGETILIPRRIEYDCDGKPVHTLLRESFEDALQQFEAFLISNQHFPYANSSEYECSVRRWYHEVERGVVYLTPEQRTQFDALLEKYASLPKIDRQKSEEKKMAE